MHELCAVVLISCLSWQLHIDAPYAQTTIRGGNRSNSDPACLYVFTSKHGCGSPCLVRRLVLLRDVQLYQDSVAPLVRDRLRLQELSEKNYDIVKWNCQQF